MERGRDAHPVGQSHRRRDFRCCIAGRARTASLRSATCERRAIRAWRHAAAGRRAGWNGCAVWRQCRRHAPLPCSRIARRQQRRHSGGSAERSTRIEPARTRGRCWPIRTAGGALHRRRRVDRHAVGARAWQARDLIALGAEKLAREASRRQSRRRHPAGRHFAALGAGATVTLLMAFEAEHPRMPAHAGKPPRDRGIRRAPTDAPGRAAAVQFVWRWMRTRFTLGARIRPIDRPDRRRARSPWGIADALKLDPSRIAGSLTRHLGGMSFLAGR